MNATARKCVWYNVILVGGHKMKNKMGLSDLPIMRNQEAGQVITEKDCH